jgi:MarR family transcriptional regulator, negative regulator of the multidrug operon emrRAB
MENAERLRTSNIFGALALAVADKLRETVESTSGYIAAAPSAIVHIGANPNESIDKLRQTLELSHSAAVRIAERLESDGLVKKSRGSDGRVAMLTLTPAGRSVMYDILLDRRSMLNGILDDLAADEWAALSRIAEKVMPRLVASRKDSDHVCRLCDEDVCPYDRCPVEPAGGFQPA